MTPEDLARLRERAVTDPDVAMLLDALVEQRLCNPPPVRLVGNTKVARIDPALYERYQAGDDKEMLATEASVSLTTFLKGLALAGVETRLYGRKEMISAELLEKYRTGEIRNLFDLAGEFGGVDFDNGKQAFFFESVKVPSEVFFHVVSDIVRLFLKRQINAFFPCQGPMIK